jgi:hypothetical protein
MLRSMPGSRSSAAHREHEHPGEHGGVATLALWRVEPPLRFVPLRRPVGGLRGRGELIPAASEDDRIEWASTLEAS